LYFVRYFTSYLYPTEQVEEKWHESEAYDEATERYDDLEFDYWCEEDFVLI
jgi:hypothetical protein